MKKLFEMRKHRDRNREQDKRYRDDLEEYEDDYSEEDDFYEEDDYPEDEDDEYFEDDEYPEDDEESPEDEDYSEDDESYEEDDRDYEDDDRDYEDDDRDYEDDDRDYEDDDRDYEDDDRDYEDEDEDYDDRGRGRNDRDRDDDESVGAKILGFITNMTVVDRIAIFFAILIIAGAVGIASFYVNGMKGNRQLESFAEIGTNLTDMDIIGQSGLIAVADSEKAKAMAVQLITTDEEAEQEKEVEVADDDVSVTIKMTVTSIKSDLKVKFINSQTGKLVANLPLEIEVVNPDGSTVTYNDHDQDGIIYKKDLTAGEYKVTPKALGAGYEKYNLEIASKSVTVKDTVEMKVVDVSNEVKKESQVNVAQEDTQVKTEVESKLQDTVEWVESTKTPVGTSSDGTYSYEEISKDLIVRPDSASMVGARRWMFLTVGAEVDTEKTAESESTETPSEDASNASSTEEKPSEEQKKEETPSEEPQNEETTKEIISVSVSNTTMTEGDEQSVSISGTSKEVSLSSSNESVVSVSGKNIKAVGAGNATITASADNCESGSVTIEVKAKEQEKPQSDFSVNGSTLSVKEGTTVSIGATATSAITYESKDTSIATVDSNGNVTGVKAGSTGIILKADGYRDGTVNVTVAKSDVKDIRIDKTEYVIREGERFQLNVLEPGYITFESANTDLVTVDSSGNVEGIKEGTTNIIIRADGYNDKTIKVTVSNEVHKKIKVESEKITVKVSENAQIKVTEPSKVTYEVADKNVATVDATGKVTGVSVGKTTVKITADPSVGSYEVLTVNIEVIAKEGNPVPMSIKKITIVEGQAIKLASSDSNVAIKLESANTNIAVISETTITGKAAGETTVKVSAAGYADVNIAVTVVSKDTILKDKNGNEIYVLKNDGSYYKATYEDYYTRSKFYLKTAATSYRYTGWQTIDNKTYFFNKDGNYVTGEQIIQGAKYTFGADGVLAQTSGAMGIDVSKWNGNIDWAAVKNSGVNFVIIRCGYRGSSQGALIEDSKFKSNINGALNAGLKVGVYFFTQAVNEVEAVEEASMVINLIKGYNLSFPVYLDVEGSNGRGDAISAGQRTANIKAFCGTISNAGYKAGVYANKTWFTSMINTSQITNYKIWLAQYASAVTYNASRYDMWQYSSKGKVTGISGNVDMNICY